MHKYTAVLSEAGRVFEDKLSSLFDVVYLPPDKNIASPVSSHPDMIMFSLNNSLVVPAAYYNGNRDLIDTLVKRCELRLITTDCKREAEYPFDVSLNVLVCDGNAFSLKEHTAGEVRELTRELGYTLHNVKQGYAACSAVSLGNAVISADPSIIKSLENVGIDALKILPGHIILDGYNEGFIGGASGVCENTVYFLGNIDSHPDSKKIRRFIEAHGFDVFSLGDGGLTDLGGIKFFSNKD